MTKFIAMAFALLLGSAHAQSLQGRDFNADGTADGYYDTAQNITWLADANYYATTGGALGTTFFGETMAPGQLSFVDALAWAATVSVHGIDGWRLPDRFVPAGGPVTSQCNATACNPQVSWPTELGILAGSLGNAAGPFSNMQSGWYLTNTEDAPGRNGLYIEMRDMLNGSRFTTDETSLAWGYVMLARSGDVGATVTPVPEPSTYALMFVGLAALTAKRWRRSPAKLAGA